MDGIYMGQPYYPPLWDYARMAVASQERQRLQRLPPHSVIEEYIAVKARFEDERSATMKYVQDLQRDKMIQEAHVRQLSEEVVHLKAIREEERLEWEKKTARSEEEIATRKHKQERDKKEWALKLAEIDKFLSSLKEESEKVYARARQVEIDKEVHQAKEKEAAMESKCTKLKLANEKMKKEVEEWKRKFFAAREEMNILQDNFMKALLKSKPRLIDLHYLVVQRLPPAARPFASAVCFSLGLNMDFSCADDNFQVTAAFRRWLECGSSVSSVPRTWGGLLVALRRDFCDKEIPDTWVDEIAKDLVDGGVAALPAPEHFCWKCRQDFSKEHECYEIKDDSEGMTEPKKGVGHTSVTGDGLIVSRITKCQTRDIYVARQ